MVIIIDCYLLSVRDNADQSQLVGIRNEENIKEGGLSD